MALFAVRNTLLLSALLATAAPIHAWAGAAEDAASDVEGVTVTARAHDTVGSTASKLATPLVDTPQSVSVITAKRIDDLGLQSLNQALRYTSGVTPETRGGVVTRYDQFKLRGFDVDNTYLDGLSSLYPGWYAEAQVDASTVDRIEILKGPASVLYGSSPPGGLVSFVSKTPKDVAGGELEFRVGDHGLVEGSVDLTGPVAGDPRYSYRLIAMARQGDGQANTTEYQRYLLMPSFTWRPDDATTVTVLGRYQHDPKSNSYGGAPSKGSAFSNPLGQLSPDFYDGDPNFEAFNRSQASIGLIADRRLSDIFAIHQNLRFTRVESNYQSVYSTSLLADNRTLTRATAASLESSDGFASDTQLSARFTTGALIHDVLVGLDYQNSHAKVQAGFGAAPNLDIFNPVYGQTIPDPGYGPGKGYDMRIVQKQTGLYLQDQIKLDRLVVLLGARHDDLTQDTSYLPSPWFPTKTSANIDQDHVSGRVGVLYRFGNGLAPYASWSQSFEPQGAYGTRVFEPITGQQVEAGVKFESRDKRVYATLAAFEIKRQKVLSPDPANTNESIQGGEVRSRGVEFEGRAKITDRLELSGAATVLDIEYTRDMLASADGVTYFSLKGRAPVGVADKTTSIFADYEFAGPLEGVGAGLGVRYVGSSYGNPVNSFKAPSYTLVDLSLRYDLGRMGPGLKGWQAKASVTNLFDRRYVSSCYSDAWCWFGAERSAQVALKRTW